MRHEILSVESEKFRVEMADIDDVDLPLLERHYTMFVYVAADPEADGTLVWEAPEYHHSYLTKLPVTCDTYTLMKALAKILVALESNGDGLTLKSLSVMDESWFEETVCQGQSH